MALPLIYLVGAGVAVLYASRKTQPQGDTGDSPFDPPSRNPLLNQGGTVATGALRIASQLQRDRFIKGAGGTTPVTPPTNEFTKGGGISGGKPIGFR